MFTNGYVGTIEGGKNLSDDSFFTQAAYQGAVPASNDWTQGWTLKSGIAEETIEELKGEITTSKTLTEGIQSEEWRHTENRTGCNHHRQTR